MIAPAPAIKLVPSRDGQRLAVLDHGQLRLVDLGGAAPELAIPAPGAVDLALFEQELWLVEDGGATLRRYALDLRATGALRLPPGRGLVRAPFGAPAALWQAERPLVITAPAGTLTTTPLAGALDAELVLPLSTTRWATIAGHALTLHDDAGPRWREPLDPSFEPIALGALFDGRSLATVLSRREDDAGLLQLFDLRDGRPQQRLALHGVTGARFASRRGLVVLIAGAHRLMVVDARFGKVLCQHTDPQEILEVALDDAGEHLVLRVGSGDGDELVDLPVRDLIAGRISVAAEPVPLQAPVTPAPLLAAPPLPPPALAPAPTPALSTAPLRALRPRPPLPPCTRADALGLLDHHRRLVAALAGRAIAGGWDSGLIAFVDEARPPFEKEVSALVLGLRGLAAPQLGHAERAAAEAERALHDAEARLTGASPLAQLAVELALTPLMQRLLILCAAPALWGELARLYGILANDQHRPQCDELLLHQLIGGDGDRHTIASTLDRDQPLLRHGLIRVAGDRGRPFAALSVDPLVLRILRREPLDADLDSGTELLHGERSLEQLRAPRAGVARLLDVLAVEPGAHPVRVVVRGRIGSGRRTLIAALAARAARPVVTIDAGRLIREQRLDDLATLLRRAALRGGLPMVDGLEAIASDDRRAAELARDLLREHPGPLAIRLPHDTAPPLDPGFVQLDLPSLSIGERAEHWQAVLTARGLTVRDLDELASRFRIGPGVIERVADQIAIEVPDHADRPVEVSREIDLAVRQHLASRIGQVATRVERLANWSQVVLPADIQDSITELIARIRHRRTVYDTWGFDDVMTTSRGVTALFGGGPGTGKSMVAGAIASELGLDLYRVDLSRVMSKWIGETEQNLARVFDAAEEGQAIILFDEADSLFAKRTEVKSSVDRYANLEVNFLLQRLDSFEGIAILTSNFGTAIDSAFKRRLSFRLTFPFPDDDTRELLWNAHLPAAMPRAGRFDLGDLARRFRMSGGYIRNAVLRAAFLAAEEQSPLTQGHLERAIRAEFREIGKLADSGVLE